MHIVQSSIIAIAIGFCLLFALPGRRFLRHLSLTFFSVYLILEALAFAFEWLLIHPGSSYKAFWLGLLMASSFLMAPCLWLFAQEISLNARPSLHRISPMQWIVIASGVILTLPLMLAAHGGTLMADPARPAIGSTSHIIHETMLLAIALFLLQVPFYLKGCVQILKTHTRYNMALFSNIEDMSLNMLRVLIWVMAGNWVLNLLRTLRELLWDGPTKLHLLFTALEVGILLWALIAILNRSLRFNAKDQKLITESYQRDLSVKVDAAGESAKSKYAKSSLDQTVRLRVERKLHHAMQVEKLYTQNNLKLRNLSDHLNENVHYVSQVINQSLETSFYELINRYRVQFATEQLINHPRKSVIDIALDSGFNSKTTFNKAFKHALGVTPSEYRSQMTDSAKTF